MLCLKKCMCSYKTTVICGQTSWPVRGEGDKSETVIFSLCPSCLLYAVLCRSRLWAEACWPCLLGPPQRRTCSQSVSHSASLMNCDYQAHSSPWGLMAPARKLLGHILCKLWARSITVSLKNHVCVCVCVCKRFLQLEQEHELI